MKRLALIWVASAFAATGRPVVVESKALGRRLLRAGRPDFAARNTQRDRELSAPDREFPFSPYAEDAELKIGLAYYREQEYGEAVSALNDFQRMHPTNQSLHLASYYLAMSYFDQIGRADQDQTATVNAMHQFQALEQRFPESSFAELAHERIAICREMLARNQLVVSDFYFKRANYRAAESRLAELMQKYPDTPVASEALYELGTTLKKEGKKYSAAQAFAGGSDIFPTAAIPSGAGRAEETQSADRYRGGSATAGAGGDRLQWNAR